MQARNGINALSGPRALEEINILEDLEEDTLPFRASLQSFPRAEKDALTGVFVVELQGHVDFTCAPQLQQVFHEAMASANLQHLCIDMEDVYYFDSTCIGVLLKTYNRMQKTGGTLHLVCVKKSVFRVMAKLHITQLFSLHTTRENMQEALRSSQGSGSVQATTKAAY
jgi:anti-anti-sigma factor